MPPFEDAFLGIMVTLMIGGEPSQFIKLAADDALNAAQRAMEKLAEA